MKKVVKKAFTLVEILVSLSIFSIVMISVISIYIVWTEVTYKSEINSAMQENIKNIVVNISEDVMNNWIVWVADWIEICDLPTKNTNEILNKNKFCSGENVYYLWNEKWDLASDCDEKKSECYLFKKWNFSTQSNKLTNNLVTIRKLNFIVTNNWKKKVTLLLKLQPSIKAWFKSSIVENNIFQLQTTLTERNIKK